MSSWAASPAVNSPLHKTKAPFTPVHARIAADHGASPSPLSSSYVAPPDASRLATLEASQQRLVDQMQRLHEAVSSQTMGLKQFMQVQTAAPRLQAQISPGVPVLTPPFRLPARPAARPPASPRPRTSSRV